MYIDCAETSKGPTGPGEESISRQHMCVSKSEHICSNTLDSGCNKMSAVLLTVLRVGRELPTYYSVCLFEIYASKLHIRVIGGGGRGENRG